MSLPVALLAGGLGTRLGSRTTLQPKSLIDVNGKPFIVHQMELLRRSGVTRIVCCIGHLGELIRQALGSGEAWGLRITYVTDQPTLLGTGGALRLALPYLDEAFFVLYGDSYLQCDYRGVAEAFEKSGQPGLMTVFRNDNRYDRSNVVFENGRIGRYDKDCQTPDMRYIDYGLGVLRAAALEPYQPRTRFDLAALYRDLMSRNQLVGFEVRERFWEVGSEEGLAKFRQYMLQRQG